MIQILIQNGHSIESIKNYSIYQVNSFYNSICKLKEDEIKMNFALDSVSSQGSSDSIKMTMEQLNKKNKLDEIFKLKAEMEKKRGK